MPYKIPISVKAVIMDGGRVWLRKNEYQKWELPGGKLEKGEQPKETIIREVREELGFIVEPLRLLQASVLNKNRFHDEVDGVLVLVYECKLIDKVGEFEMEGEGGKSEFLQYSFAEIKSLPILDVYINAIEKVFLNI